MTKAQQVLGNLPQAQDYSVQKGQSNLYRVNFKNNGNDQFVRNSQRNQITTDPFEDRNAAIQRAIEKQQSDQKKQKAKQNLSWGIGLAASTVMLIFFGKLIRDDVVAKRKAKEAEKILMDALKDAKDGINTSGESSAEDLRNILKNCKNPQIKRAFAEEYQKGPMSMSNKKIHGLEQLAAVEASKAKIVDIKEAKKILDEEVIGMDDVKKQVIEFLNYRNYCIREGIKLDKPLVISFDGPPGTSKTTLANAIAKATGMPHKEISVAGATGKAKIIGNESVYQGASWGEIADAQIEHKTSSIVYTLDEVEKAGSSDHNGKFEDTLLPLLDDRHRVHDDFLDVDISTGDSIIILTSNDFNKLSEPLKDRISYKFKIKPYDSKLKAKIAEFKLGKALKRHNLTDKVTINSEIYDEIVKYTSDDGGREVSENAQKMITKIIKN